MDELRNAQPGAECLCKMQYKEFVVMGMDWPSPPQRRKAYEVTASRNSPSDYRGPDALSEHHTPLVT